MVFASDSLAAKNGLGAVQGGCSARGAGLRHKLAIAEGHHQVIGHLPDVPHLESRVRPELVLNRQVPLIVDGRLHVLIPETKMVPGEARIVRASKTRRAAAR